MDYDYDAGDDADSVDYLDYYEDRDYEGTEKTTEILHRDSVIKLKLTVYKFFKSLCLWLFP